MRRIYNLVKKWCNETFGKDRDPYTIMVKMQEEVAELTMCVHEYQHWSTTQNKRKVQLEMADMMILLINLADTLDMCYDSFVDTVHIKHHVNRQRTWEKQENGTFKHSAKDNE